VLVTVFGATVTASVSGACFAWWPLPEAAAELVVVVVGVVLVVVGPGVPVELHATDSTPTATAVMPTVRHARWRMWVNDNGVSLPRKVTIGQRDSYLPARDRYQNRYV